MNYLKLIYKNIILGINDFQNNKENILNEFDNFNQYIIKQTKNILVKKNENIISFKLKEAENYNVFILYCNDFFLDAGEFEGGKYNLEEQELLSILKNTFIS